MCSSDLSVGILSAPCLPPALTLGISLLLVSKVTFNLDSVVVELGFILEAARIYIYYKTTCLVPYYGYIREVVKASSSSYMYAPNLLYKPILIAYPYLNKLTRISVLLGYIDSIINKVLILPLR